MPPPTAPPKTKYLIFSTPRTALAISIPYRLFCTWLVSIGLRSKILRSDHMENATARLSIHNHAVDDLKVFNLVIT